MQVRLNITQKFISFLLLTSVIPLLTVGLSSYQVSRKILQEEAIKYTAELVFEQKNYLELQLQQIESLIANISGVDEIIDVLDQKPPASDTYISLATHARIGYILNGYTSLDGLVSIDIFTMTGVHYHVGDTLDISKIRNLIKNKILAQALGSDQRVVWVGIEDNVNANSSAQKVITVAKLLHKNDAQTLRSEPVAMLLVNYSVDYLYRHFKQVDLGRGAYLLLIDNQRRIIYHPDKRFIGIQVNNDLMQRISGAEGTFIQTVDGQKMLITYRRSAMSGWMVLSFIPLNTLVEPTVAIGMTTTLALSLSFLIILIAAWLVSDRLVKPIRQITQRFELFQHASLDWRAPLEVRSHDEIGELSRWFNTFLDSLAARQQAEDALRESIERERATLRVVERMRQTLDLDQIFHITTRELQHLLKCDRVSIFRLETEGRGTFVAEAIAPQWQSWLPADGDQESRGNEIGDRHLIDLWSYFNLNAIDPVHTRYCCIQDRSELLDKPDLLQQFSTLQLKACLIVPIFQGNQHWGFLASYQHGQAYQWDDNEINHVIHISTQLGIALQQIELFAQTQQQSTDLEKARDAAETANRAKSQFLANMSHELRTPLNAILGFTQLLVNDAQLKAGQQEMLATINRSGEHLLRLINDVLDMSKIEAGKVTPDEQTFDLHNLLNSLENTFQLPVSDKHLQLIVIRAAGLPQYIRTDEGKLNQILSNLLSNAIKFTQAGTITVRVKTCSESGVKSSYPYSVDYPLILNIEVEDTGPGIAPQELPILFDPFVQTETGRKSQQGTGLGLSITHGLLQLMGGSIEVNSVMGVGTLFKVTLPVKLPEPAQVARQADLQRAVGLMPGQPTYRILIVDDAKTNRLILVRLLSEIGFELREAENGQDALTLWKDWFPHLILMDMKMPTMDGYEATQQIRKHEWSAHSTHTKTVIIAITANAFDEERQRVLEIGCDDFLSKPFRQQILLQKVAEHLGVQYCYEEVKNAVISTHDVTSDDDSSRIIQLRHNQ